MRAATGAAASRCGAANPAAEGRPRAPAGAGLSSSGRRGEIQIARAQPVGDRPRFAVCHEMVVDADHRQHEAGGACEERLAGGKRLFHAERALIHRQLLRLRPGRISRPSARVTITPSFVTMNAEDDVPSVTNPSSTIQASKAPRFFASCLPIAWGRSAILLMSRRTQRRSGVVMTFTPVSALGSPK